MSLATRCTHCGTIFKVVEDQLKVSDGWVRCGRCQEVFHALPTLFDLDREAPPPRTPASPPADAATAPTPQTEPPTDTEGTPSQLPSEWPATMPQADLEPAASANGDATVAPEASAVPDVAAGPRIGSQPAPTQTRSWLAPVPATTEFDLDTALPASAPEEAPADSTAPPANAPTAAPTPVVAGLDDIELDTAVELTPKVPPNALAHEPISDLNAPLALNISPMGEPAPTGTRSGAPADSPPQETPVPPEWAHASRYDLVPSTEESDALDSRYLLPSTRKEKAASRRSTDTPDFADAKVPDDWLLDVEEELAQELGLPHGHAAPQPHAATPAIQVLAEPRPANAAPADESPSTIPSRFLDEAEAMAAPQASAATGGDRPTAPAAETQPGGRSTGGLRRKAKATPATEQAPAFLKQAQAQARWRHPAMRATLATLALLLMGLLTGQVMHQFRDQIAAYHPPLRPALARWCDIAGCTLQPPLRIEDLQVDSLSFVRATSEGPDVYRLTVVLHNKAPIDLAWPNIDLSLSDLSGAVILRTVFKPQDASWQDNAEAQPGPGQAMPAAAPAQRSTTLQWRMKIAKLQPAGYTADIFYP